MKHTIVNELKWCAELDAGMTSAEDTRFRLVVFDVDGGTSAEPKGYWKPSTRMVLASAGIHVSGEMVRWEKRKHRRGIRLTSSDGPFRSSIFARYFLLESDGDDEKNYLRWKTIVSILPPSPYLDPIKKILFSNDYCSCYGNNKPKKKTSHPLDAFKSPRFRILCTRKCRNSIENLIFWVPTTTAASYPFSYQINLYTYMVHTCTNSIDKTRGYSRLRSFFD